MQELDIFAVVGSFTAFSLEATVQQTSPSLVLEFQGIVENPKISGFEIFDVTGTHVQPTLINCGGPDYVDANNRVWMADSYCSGGGSFDDSAFGIDSTVDDPLYQTERNGLFSYNIPVSTGSYTVILSFAELFWGSPNERVFDIYVQDVLAATAFDIVSMTGGNFIALQLTIPHVDAVDGFITIVSR